MENVYSLSDAEIVKRISVRLKGLRLKQNISRQDLSASTGVSVSSIARMEDGEIKSFDSLLRMFRTLGTLDILVPLVEEEEMSPNEYYKIMNSEKSRTRKRASKNNKVNVEEESEW